MSRVERKIRVFIVMMLMVFLMSTTLSFLVYFRSSELSPISVFLKEPEIFITSILSLVVLTIHYKANK